MYKVFFKDSCFLLTDEQNPAETDTDRLSSPDSTELQTFIHRLLTQGNRFTAVIQASDTEQLFRNFCSCFCYVQAAGGVVCQQSALLAIRRLGMTDLPKGHLEDCETIEACAIREVEEECGIRDLHILVPLSPTFHIYPRQEKFYLKKTHWFLMNCTPGQSPTPQTEEDIEEVYWLPLSRIPQILSTTYASLRPVFREVQERCEKGQRPKG